MEIIIEPALKKAIPQTSLGIIEYEVSVVRSSIELQLELTENLQQLAKKYDLSEIVTIPAIHATREAYKTLGKSPSSYRNAAEAMLRRIVKGNGLYQINNIVEINNIMSTTSGFSIGSYDYQQVTEPIYFKKADPKASYQGIGKEELNIEFLPTLYDEQGPFGNPTSDSQRTMIKNGKRHIFSVVYSFSGEQGLKKLLANYQHLLSRYTDAIILNTQIV